MLKENLEYIYGYSNTYNRQNFIQLNKMVENYVEESSKKMTSFERFPLELVEVKLNS